MNYSLLENYIANAMKLYGSRACNWLVGEFNNVGAMKSVSIIFAQNLG